ncbi:hypothetical protein AAHA92_06338 [Salvia divinorum]|uniref:CCHC-type domain-containing protein n=1 Tax=Salvia divinorum TaxID=28513 RepID=A0ABD1I9B0_SALDI
MAEILENMRVNDRHQSLLKTSKNRLLIAKTKAINGGSSKCNKEHGKIYMVRTDIYFACSECGHLVKECPKKSLEA